MTDDEAASTIIGMAALAGSTSGWAIANRQKRTVSETRTGRRDAYTARSRARARWSDAGERSEVMRRGADAPGVPKSGPSLPGLAAFPVGNRTAAAVNWCAYGFSTGRRPPDRRRDHG